MRQTYNPHVVWGSLVVFLLFFVVWAFLFSPPRLFPTTASDIFTIEKGASLQTIADDLGAAHFVRFPLMFRFVTRARGAQTMLVAGDYAFTKPLDVFALLERISHGKFDLLPVRVTIPEGLTKFEVASVLEKRIAHFDTKTFVENAAEGYLFPDTYYLARNASARDIIEIMEENFDTKITEIEKEIATSKRSLEDVVKMASIVELEARQSDTRKIIAGILWKRIDMNMPLQVDVSFKYINGKTTNEITDEDLKLDSPYNSYKYRGLPPTPISNPGLDALTAAVLPSKTPYLFFLSDREGTMHYAQTFEKHKINKEKYLR